MAIDIRNKVVLLTGAAGGIGKCIAEGICETGVKLFLVDINEEKLSAQCNEINANGGCAEFFTANLLKEESYKMITDKCKQTFGGIDILINCAGMALNQPFENVTMEMFNKIFSLNVYAPAAMMRECLPHLENSDYAMIINITSAAAHQPFSGQSLYVGSKHALFGLTKCVSQEIFERNLDIRVHTVAPTGVYTDMIAIARPDLDPKTMCLPEEIAQIIEFLITHRNNSIIDDVLIRRHTKMPWT